MIELYWPWALCLLPLPYFLRRWLPPRDQVSGAALRVPFFALLRELKQASGGHGWGRPLLSAWVLWLLLLLALAQPLWLGGSGAIPTTGRDLMLVVDISGSMRQMDFVLEEEPADRLTAVKRVVGKFIDHRRGDRLGLILFGARPYLRAPLSHDHRIIKTLLEEAEIALAGEYTAVGDAIGLAVKRMRALPADSRAMVLLTDGDNNSGSIGPRQAADIAAEFGIRIHAVGIGRAAAAAPNPYGIWSSEGAADFDREVLESIAGRTGGVFFHVLDTRGLQAAYRDLDRLEPALGEDIKVYYGIALYPWPLAAALILSVWMVYAGSGRTWPLFRGLRRSAPDRDVVLEPRSPGASDPVRFFEHREP